ncbi:dicarboxylate/amino acid:cation symporter [Hydrogenibacillus sp. N12]|uniref:dicarboxylate/amino acid:cation symporter n=1 Tax=Hydrogenibacillus sp. N12 TaxID=2866627 RepID=UPI001C7DF2E5|nr:dicarboxylate/amino acid:cation symporter [Hydrogenibacillus sp. N12]QZA33663.1 dicarboxylate/amino acid:cation symporter [Hydrogenibacillus sp. N12]
MQHNVIEAISTNALSLTLAFLAVFVLAWLRSRRVSFGSRVMIALGLGLVTGMILHQTQASYDSLKTFGQMFVNLIKMIVMPLVVAAVISGITSLAQPEQLKRIGGLTIGLFLITTGLGAAIGVIVALLIHPGSGVNLSLPSDFKAREIPTFWQVLLDLWPLNPIDDMAKGKVVPAIIFALFFALAMVGLERKNPDQVASVKNFVQSFANIMYEVTKSVIRLTPYGVFMLIAAMSASYGWETLLPLMKVIIATYGALAVHFLIVFIPMIIFLNRVQPLVFLRKIYPMMIVAFTTRSSYAVLPINIEIMVKRLKIPENIASFVASLGTAMNYNGCGGVWPAVVAIFAAEAYGIPLNWTDDILIVFVATISSIGVAGVPGPASISTTVVLTALGLPLEALGLVLAVDALVDMGRTLINRTGDPIIALFIARREGQFDEKAFYEPDDEALTSTMSAGS